jgi:[protein-PII] uridylyltransferase
MGFDAEAVDLVGTLVRRHLLLAETATTRDPDDPATVDLVASAIGNAEALSLLTALTEADARATSAKAWTRWRAGLVHDLARRAAAALDRGTPPPVVAEDVSIPKETRKGGAHVAVEQAPEGSKVTVIDRDRIGLLADIAAVFALQRVPVRAARAWPQDQYAVSVWEVAEEHLDAAVLRQRYDAVVDGRLDPAGRLRPPDAETLAPTVVVRPEASAHATVLEVRAADRPGVVYLVCAALAGLGIAVRSAHVDTLGPQAVDVFYLQEDSAGALGETRAAEAAHAVRSALSGESR